jgi:acyl dehydratase
MAMEDLEGTTYGPYPFRTDPEKVAEYTEIAGADAGSEHGPPSLAGALLFCVAPHLLADDRAGDATHSVIHGDQSFAWHRPIPLGVELSVSGTVSRVRERGGVFFTNFDLEVAASGSPVVSGSSTFLMSSGSAASTADGVERPEPPPLHGSVRESFSGTLGDEAVTLGRFSASRADLVRYAGASRDWNPIHWDHGAAVDAGLPGVVVHGLLQSAWVIEAAVRAGIDPRTARFRYRRPLGAAIETRLSGTRRGNGASFELADDAGPYLTATVE